MTIKNIGNIAALVAIWALSLILIGAAARIAVVLFCLGYGCST